LEQGSEKKHQIEACEELADDLLSMKNIGVKAYRIDATQPENMSALMDYLISRGSKKDLKSLS
jgi:hypothetical protein